ncbi:lasso peptide isopeptide bond-forming cyclase [Aquibacillus saliphilus]|uniref:lasso peptide isopeptide bond-forming cyclase n=1 Tax=Aquibacillus saliphilus TaxID=1909422 RepID=UPI00271461EC|nr:lasso peptide isopeptide bond-forming cyclase [Aquibacillus saliphilus]
MSAIAGILHCNKEPIPIGHSNGMMKKLQFPADDIKVLYRDYLFFGCHAQWITPESVGEPLPYYDNERKLAITADAIIDNRNELFQKLQVGKDEGKIMPDSQLILLAYYKWGEDTPKHLIGDFAFMIWDEKEHKLFGARDFSGSRTLYYFNNQNRFGFCTIMEPLLSLPYVKKKLNEQWLAEYLAIPNMIDSVNASSTVIKDIKQVPPSHTITMIDGKTTISRYYTLDLNKTIKFKKDKDYVESFREVFQEAVDARLRTDYPVGSQLSGGLDSSSVVGFAAKPLMKKNRTLHTFSFIPERDFIDWTPKYRMADERPFISSTVQHLSNIDDHYLDFAGKSPLSEIDDWLEVMEMPYKFFENSVWVKGIYESASQKGIKVLLNGSRGNFGISWGPALDYYGTLIKKMKWISLYRELNLYSQNTGVKDKFRILSIAGKKAFPFLNKSKEVYQLPMIINPNLAEKTDVFKTFHEHGIDKNGSSNSSIYEKRNDHFTNPAIWNTTGTSGTKLSLRYSIWNRDPTNDLRVIQFCLSLPEDQFVMNGMDRALIRRATKGYLPDEIRLNQRVRGIQGADWVHRVARSWGLFIEELLQLVNDPLVSDYLNIPLLQLAIYNAKEGPKLNNAFDPELRILMRSLIIYRFIKRFHLKGGDNTYEEDMETASVGGFGN